MGSDGPASAGASGRLDMTMMLVVHDAFRRDLAHLARAADRRPADLDDPACHTAVLAGWEVFRTQLHLHHTGEDRRLWPRMRDHLAGRPDELAMLQAMQDEHARIDPLLAAVDGDLADRDRGPARLGERVDALATELSGHLAHEERDALPLLDRVLPVAEWQRFAADERRAPGASAAPRSCSPGCWTAPRPSGPRRSCASSRRRYEWSTAASGSPATPAMTTGSRPCKPTETTSAERAQAERRESACVGCWPAG